MKYVKKQSHSTQRSRCFPTKHLQIATDTSNRPKSQRCLLTTIVCMYLYTPVVVTFRVFMHDYRPHIISQSISRIIQRPKRPNWYQLLTAGWLVILWCFSRVAASSCTPSNQAIHPCGPARF